MSEQEGITPPGTPTAVTATQDAPPKRSSRIKGIITILVMLAFSIAIIIVTTHYRDELQQLGNAGYLGLFLVSIVGNATIVIPAPVFVVACAAGMVYGPIQVGLIAGFGAALGELTGYYAGRGGAAVIPTGKLYNQLKQFMRQRGMLAIFLLAAIPNPIFDIGGVIAGALRMKVWQFVFAASLGKALRLGITAYICLGGIPFLQQWLHF